MLVIDWRDLMKYLCTASAFRRLTVQTQAEVLTSLHFMMTEN